MAAVAAAAAPAISFASGHYHFSVANVGRGSGAPVVAKAAYRSGECLYDERIQQTFDYRGGAERVVDTWVMARENAPPWMQHAPREARQRAWNEAERADDNPKARIATELVVGLPHELTMEQRKNLLSGFVRRLVEKHGVFADVSIHTAHDDRNIHSHILLSHRELGPEGFGEIANRRTITRKHRGQVKEMTTAGIASTPADVKFLRKEWADHVNSAYQRAGLDIRVDHRSFEDRGLQLVPTIHLGARATAAERRGYATDRGDTNRIIEFGNAELQRLEGEKQRQDAAIIYLQKALADRLAQRQRDEIPPQKATTMQTPEPPASRNNHELAGKKPDLENVGNTPPRQEPNTANQNSREPPPGYRVGESVPVTFGPETIAASKQRRPESEDMDEEDRRKQVKADIAKDIEDSRTAYVDMIRRKEDADRFLQNWQVDREEGERRKQDYQQQRRAEDSNLEIHSPQSRYLIAAGMNRDFIGTVRTEGAMIQQEHDRLTRDAILEKDDDKRRSIELKRDIQMAEYHATVRERIAAMSNLGGDQYKQALADQERWQDVALKLRQERQEHFESMADKAIKGDLAHAEAVVKADQEKRQTVIKEWDVTQGKPLENGPIIPQTPENEARIKAMRTAPFEPIDHDPSTPALRVIANDPDNQRNRQSPEPEVTDRKAETDDRAQARNDAERQRASNDASRQAHYDALKGRDGGGRDKGGGISY
jgi:hypothetical protein